MGVRVTAVDDQSVVLERPGTAGSERIDARTVIWAAGVQASPLAGMLAQPPRPHGCPSSPADSVGSFALRFVCSAARQVADLLACPAP